MDVPKRLAVVYGDQSWMTMPERVLLYGIVAALAPERTLEIGTYLGGSALIIAAALDDVCGGALWCVDPNPRVAEDDWRRIEHRATMIAEASPQALMKARELAGAPFDLVLIDGDHTLDGVRRDIAGTLPVLADEAWLLLHDAHFPEIRDAIVEALGMYRSELHDGGLLSKHFTTDENGVIWGGLRLLRFKRDRRGHVEDLVAKFTRLASVSDEEFVDAVYEILLGRHADPEGIRTWTGRLSVDARLTVLQGITDSQEARERGVDAEMLEAASRVAELRKEPITSGLVKIPRFGKRARSIARDVLRRRAR
jgi:hypothetical protein